LATCLAVRLDEAQAITQAADREGRPKGLIPLAAVRRVDEHNRLLDAPRSVFFDQLRGPLGRTPVVWRVEEHAAEPGLRQPVVVLGEVMRCLNPGLRDWIARRIERDRSEDGSHALDDRRRRVPFIRIARDQDLHRLAHLQKTHLPFAFSLFLSVRLVNFAFF
jgi:hypothetical protein